MEWSAHLSLLRCPRCETGAALQLRPGTPHPVPGVDLADEHLSCAACGADFPVTRDGIPILWDRELEASMRGERGWAPLSANLSVYEKVSDDYSQYTHRAEPVMGRIREAARQLLREPVSRTGETAASPVHLDFGCGPGHVLGWLKDLGFLQVGLDISLKNLRNARQATGCLVVCGNACAMPLADGAARLVTESSALHHIDRWPDAVSEAARVCGRRGALLIDSEPSRDQLAWGAVATALYRARTPVYRALSRLIRSKYLFQSQEVARLNELAEIHHRPQGGIPPEEVGALLEGAGFRIRTILSPTPDLSSKAVPTWQAIVLGLLSLRNPWNPRYGSFMVLASRGTPE